MRKPLAIALLLVGGVALKLALSVSTAVKRGNSEKGGGK